MKTRLVCGILVVLALAACQKSPTQTPAPSAPPPQPYRFTARLVLTEKAAARLKARPETLTVNARYYGLPTAATQGQADRNGVIALGVAHASPELAPAPVTLNGVTYPVSAQLALDLADAPPHALSGVAGGKVLAQLKVAAPRDDLDCTGFQDYVATAQSRQITLVCDVT